MRSHRISVPTSTPARFTPTCAVCRPSTRCARGPSGVNRWHVRQPRSAANFSTARWISLGTRPERTRSSTRARTAARSLHRRSSSEAVAKPHIRLVKPSGCAARGEELANHVCGLPLAITRDELFGNLDEAFVHHPLRPAASLEHDVARIRELPHCSIANNASRSRTSGSCIPLRPWPVASADSCSNAASTWSSSHSLRSSS